MTCYKLGACSCERTVASNRARRRAATFQVSSLRKLRERVVDEETERFVRCSSFPRDKIPPPTTIAPFSLCVCVCVCVRARARVCVCTCVHVYA